MRKPTAAPIDLRDVTLLIPASGLSERFGAHDKLLADLAGQPLAQHVIDSVSPFKFARRIAVLPNDAPAREALFRDAGFEIVHNLVPELGLGESLFFGAATCDTRRLLICLADMPLVPPRHIERLLTLSQPMVEGAVMSEGSVAQPPAVIIGETIDKLKQGALMRGFIADTAALPQALLDDVDTIESLEIMSRNWLTLAARRDSFVP